MFFETSLTYFCISFDAQNTTVEKKIIYIMICGVVCHHFIFYVPIFYGHFYKITVIVKYFEGRLGASLRWPIKFIKNFWARNWKVVEMDRGRIERNICIPVFVSFIQIVFHLRDGTTKCWFVD